MLCELCTITTPLYLPLFEKPCMQSQAGLLIMAHMKLFCD